MEIRTTGEWTWKPIKMLPNKTWRQRAPQQPITADGTENQPEKRRHQAGAGNEENKHRMTSPWTNYATTSRHQNPRCVPWTLQKPPATTLSKKEICTTKGSQKIVVSIEIITLQPSISPDAASIAQEEVLIIIRKTDGTASPRQTRPWNIITKEWEEASRQRTWWWFCRRSRR